MDVNRPGTRTRVRGIQRFSVRRRGGRGRGTTLRAREGKEYDRTFVLYRVSAAAMVTLYREWECNLREF